SGTRGGLRRQISEGIRVSAEMPNPKVARITIDVDWQHLVSRVARTVRRRLKNRSGPPARALSTAARPRRPGASYALARGPARRTGTTRHDTSPTARMTTQPMWNSVWLD